MSCRQAAFWLWFTESPQWYRSQPSVGPYFCTSASVTSSFRTSVFSNSPSVTLVSVSSPDVPQTAVEAQAAPSGDVNCVLPPHSQCFQTGGAKEVQRSPGSVPTVFPEARSGDQVSSALLLTVLCLATTSLRPQKRSSLISDLPSQMFSDHGVPNLSALSLSPCTPAQIVSAKHTISPEYLLFLSVSTGVRPDGLTTLRATHHPECLTCQGMERWSVLVARWSRSSRKFQDA